LNSTLTLVPTTRTPKPKIMIFII